ncbi:MAG: bifunctional hydroxymethylpyrimidine kinase/phosphomethylpyrimidine kinase [Dehalococcoidia bacterium]|nr:bifunctional hydroxymethylpyrimidine kinase/phosphomethylpyrimidine kinase [Dehalococcoidia bacterium]MDW8119151.1 bifunctional hydroxymethylpyrimidine kinase/phosphomethylpyrimidine kinase [Chloroflexota bacterium]
MTQRVPVAMTIAGSDSGGGAGIQADLKTFAALGVYGTCVITALTAQNTLRVTAVHEVPPDFVAAQIDTVVSDIPPNAVKTGMLANAAIIGVVAQKVREWRLPNLVVDPVMVAKSGDRLLREDAISALQTVLLPLATVVTPNIPEAEALTGMPIATLSEARQAAQALVQMGAKVAVVKGGHRRGPAIDVVYDGREFHLLRAPRVETTSTHGTGCTFASAIAAGLAQGMPPLEAIRRAKRYVTTAMRRAFPLGRGHGPLHHFYRLWPLLER